MKSVKSLMFLCVLYLFAGFGRARFSLSVLIPGVFVKRGEALGKFLLRPVSLSTYIFSQIRYVEVR